MDNEYNLRQINPTNTAVLWTSINPILLKGELGFESDTHFFKIGDGVTPWNDLPYSNSSTHQLLPGEGITIESQVIGALLLYDEINA